MNNFTLSPPSLCQPYAHPFYVGEVQSHFIAQPGDKLRVVREFYDHVGTMGYDGLIYAGSAKYGRVCKVTPEQFSDGFPIVNQGRVGPRSTEEIIDIYEMLLDNPYGLVFSNCEHTDNYARGLGWKSEQVDDILFYAGVGVAAALIIVAISKR